MGDKDKVKNDVSVDIDDFHYHEALDRTHLISLMIDETLLNHPVINKHKGLLENIQEAQKLLDNSYQHIGTLRDEFNNE